MLRLAWFSVFFTLFPGCSSDPCDCGVGAYCCFGVCQAVGTVCGDAGVPDDAPVADAPRSVAEDAPISGSPDAAGACADAVFRCDGDVLLQCNEGEVFLSRPCDAPNDRCVEFVAREGMDTTRSAACLAPGQAACEADALGSRCEGDELVSCRTNTPYLPPYLESRMACSSRYPGGTCVDSGGARCDVPSAEACDPATYFGGCGADRRSYASCDGSIGRVLSEACSEGFHPGAYCYENTESVRDRVRICLPPGATPTGEPPSTPERWLSCEGDAVRARGQGYEYVRSCPARFSLEGVRIPQVCYALSSGVTCDDPGMTRCDAATEVPRCTSPTTSESCDGLVRTTPCTWSNGGDLLTIPCMPETGTCPDLSGTGCDPSGRDYCVPGTTQYLARCDPGFGLYGRALEVVRCASACTEGTPEARCL